MTAARSRRTGGRSGAAGRPRRGLIWQGSIGSVTLAVGAQAMFTLVDQTLQDAYFDSTVVRIRGDYSAILDLSSGTTANRFYVGMMVVSEEAAAAGTGSVPVLSVDTGADWLYWRSHPIGGSGVTTDLSQLLQTQVDNRSMRKLMGVNRRLVLKVENGANVGLQFNFALRTLVMLH